MQVIQPGTITLHSWHPFGGFEKYWAPVSHAHIVVPGKIKYVGLHEVQVAASVHAVQVDGHTKQFILFETG